ncbi:TIGR00730 family Rossman fold protein [Paenalkalicoccus suaedae]|uniref:Cytokinin riboside 5'-monophosphate phosphoribohydrolase n=1 Tax=Paenalkalicoccus suaedae TaxID=2592382 RepID=A0A859FCE7_9BACI|nr:TIGR00730 family Rossman fold protein [Paenalkalicoccus suaedae]QKS70432.1 TIGR00730 family Rossman fold protein [Paenalkalicoccus suaedae]
MRKIAVFCGSSSGQSEMYTKAAQKLGNEFASRDIKLIYGGGAVGIMGAVANAVLEGKGTVTGVMPKMLEEREIAHPELTELVIVDSMHERKSTMAELADGFLILPGGAGTMEEFFEVFTWAQLGLHAKPIGILNIDGYYEPLLNMLDHMVRESFLHESFLSMLLIGSDSGRLVDTMMTYEAPSIQRYVNDNSIDYDDM